MANDPAFARIIADYRLPTVLATIGLASKKVAAPHSLIRLNGLLVRFLVDENEQLSNLGDVVLKVYKTQIEKKKESARRAQRIGRELIKQEAITNKEACRTAAREYAINNSPMPDKKRIVAHVLTLGIARTTKAGKKTPLTANTIGRLIAGVMEEARQSSKPTTDLYNRPLRNRSHA